MRRAGHQAVKGVTLAFLASLLEQFERARRPGDAIAVAIMATSGGILIHNPEGTE